MVSSELPSVAVVIPAYNRLPHVVEAVQSVLAQDYPNTRCVVVDDASTDGTAETLTRLFGDKILLLRNEVNLEKSASRNRGARESGCDLLCFLDSDDTLAPDSLTGRADRFIRNPEFYGVVFGYSGKEPALRPESPRLTVGAYLENPDVICNLDYMLPTRLFLETGGYDTAMTNMEDRALFIRLLAKHPFEYVHRRSAVIRDHGQARARTNFTKILAQGLAFSDHLSRDLPDLDPSALAVIRGIDVECRLAALYKSRRYRAFISLYSSEKKYVSEKNRRRFAKRLFISKILAVLEQDATPPEPRTMSNSINIHYHHTEKNWGDSINPFLVKAVTGMTPRLTDPKWETDVAHLLCIGSVLDRATRRSVIWGSGFMFSDAKFREAPLKILGVRGPLTRKLCLEQNVECPEVYGDPALLMPKFIPADNVEKVHEFGIIPHFIDAGHPFVKAAAAAGWHVISTALDDEEFVREVNKCKNIASSSLHGLICSEAYGIPTAWLVLSDKVKGGEFKFRDYYAANGVTAKPVRITETTRPAEVPFTLNRVAPLAAGMERALLDFIACNPLARLAMEPSRMDTQIRSMKLKALIRKRLGR